jgi:hypothetical protein
MSQYGNHEQNDVAMTATGSATVFAANSTARHHITKGIVTVYGPVAAAEIDVNETYSAGTALSTLFKVPAVTANSFAFDFGDKGFALATTGSRLAFNLAADVSFTSVIVGYSR